MEDLFKHAEYRKVLEMQIQNAQNPHGYKSILAKAAGCQPSYLSQVLGGDRHLTPEQAANLIDFWQLSSQEGEFFFTLVLKERAGTRKLRARLDKKLQEIVSQAHRQKEKFFQIQEEEQRHALRYYSQWQFAAIHTLVSIPRLKTAAALAKCLRLSEKEIVQSLNLLVAMGLVELNDGEYSPTAKSLHAEKNEEFANMHHRNWRHQAINSLTNTNEHDLHYTAVHTLSHEDFLEIRKLILQTIGATRKTVGPSSEEIGASLTIDWIKLGE